VGQYKVVATIVTGSNGSESVTNTITASTYMGVATCKLCHSGSQGVENKYTPWLKTGHSHIFSDGINGTLGYYRSSCIACHTVGYDPNTNSIVNPANGGLMMWPNSLIGPSRSAGPHQLGVYAGRVP